MTSKLRFFIINIKIFLRQNSFCVFKKGSRTKDVEELNYIDLIKLVLHKFLMKHFDLGKERIRKSSFMPGP